MGSKLITHVFVDFDGTLIDSISSMYQAYLDLLENYNVRGTKEEFNYLNGPSTLEIVEFLKSKHNISDSIENILERYKNIIEKKYTDSVPFHDSEYFLSEISKLGLKICIVTSSRSELCIPIIKKYSWDKFIHSYVWGEDVKNSKPFPDIYLNALNSANISKDAAIVIEDSINGVKSGSKAGLKVIGLSHEFSKKNLLQAGAFLVFENLSLVLNFLKKDACCKKN